MKRIIKIYALIISFICLSGFIPVAALIGPASTILASGNIFKAGFQFIVDQSIQKKTGKNTIMLVKNTIENKNDNQKIDEELKKLVEKRLNIAIKKIKLQNINQ